MGSLGSVSALLCLLLGLASAKQITKPVFLDKEEASVVIRQKRANAGTEEANMPPNLERECLEEVCNYDEAREIFKDSYRTDIFWSVYIDGDQCAEQPCKNGALCSDSVGGYDCVCKTGFSGVHCETDQTVCVLDKTAGCSQFCKPGYLGYECSCARGWKADHKKKEKCVPAVPHPCGKVGGQWNSKVLSNFETFNCKTGECPWQAFLKRGSVGFCSGVILKEKLVLTTAQCASQEGFTVVVGKRSASQTDSSEQTFYVSMVHTHPRYVPGLPDNDLAVVELRDRITFKSGVVAACLPERDFADGVLTTGDLPAVLIGWPGDAAANQLRGELSASRLAYDTLAACVDRHGDGVTNKMGCLGPRAAADCSVGQGSGVVSLYREVFFLTGVVSQPAGGACQKGYVYQKVSRFLPWLQPLMDSR